MYNVICLRIKCLIDWIEFLMSANYHTILSWNFYDQFALLSWEDGRILFASLNFHFSLTLVRHASLICLKPLIREVQYHIKKSKFNVLQRRISFLSKDERGKFSEGEWPHHEALKSLEDEWLREKFSHSLGIENEWNFFN